MGANEAFDILVGSWREGFVQVSGFVAVTVLLFSLLQYRYDGRLVELLEDHERLQPLAGGLLGLTPGCGGAIVAMPLYIRGSISFGTVVATLAATAGDSAFVILALAPEAALYAYALAFVSGVTFGYMVDAWGMGVGRVDDAVERFGRPMTDGGFATASVADGGPSIPDYDGPGGHGHDCDNGHGHDHDCEPGHAHGGAPLFLPDESRLLARVTHAVHVLWWVVAAGALVAGVAYLAKGAAEPAWQVALTYDGLFTVAGLLGTTLSFYLYFVGRHYIGEGDTGRVRESFASAYETFQHAAMETAMVTVWVIAGYLVFSYGMAVFGLDIRALSDTAGVLAPIAAAALGLVPGCAPQIVFAQLYAIEGAIPFSALAANAVSQDGDALFPLMAIDAKAAIIATIYTTIPAVFVGVGLHYFWPYASFGFGVLG
ncbi:putative manganese transporter [Halorussus gelatinilyticus]|uniref:Putative manganese transporter n=1 Tax=Halorussus gelatinilyticus TaxID=2937524 RepID=A0A8U0IE93_9EURY|nr:putative manganese transporter [Halorussus gelatinilyticus]UPV99386.1 putative manganese transporter [Halorussus gelatinilyticus]